MYSQWTVKGLKVTGVGGDSIKIEASYAEISRMVKRTLQIYCLLLLCLVVSAIAETVPLPSEGTLQEILTNYRYEELKKFGPDIVEPLVHLYETGDESTKEKAAHGLYYLSLKSEHAREVLMKDVHTENQQLRLSVQWALGRVSSDESVVKTLLDNMRNDPNPLFRDKAACALAHDQVHLTEKQRVILLQGLVDALEDDKDDVRRIALLALQIQTGQTKGYKPDAPGVARKVLVQPWKWWIAEYRNNVVGN